MSEDVGRRDALYKIAAAASVPLAGCSTGFSRDTETEELNNVSYSTDKVDLHRNRAVMFESKGNLFGVEMLDTQGESAKVRAGSYDNESVPLGEGSYLRAQTEELEIESGDTINSGKTGTLGFPEISIDDIDPGYAQLDFGEETDMEYVNHMNIADTPGFM